MPVASYQSGAGSTVLIEIATPPKGRGGAQLVARTKDGVIEAQSNFEEAIAGIKPIADQIVATMTSLAKQPKEAEVTFGIKFSGEVGIILAKSTLDATLQVKLKW